MRLRLDYQNRVPIYLQIADQVKQSVAAGELLPGEQLPTVREVATDLRVNFNTVARAYRLLHEEGVISTQQGRGTYVLERPSGERHGREQLLAELAAAWLVEAARFGFSAAEAVRAVEAAATSARDGCVRSGGTDGPDDGQEE